MVSSERNKPRAPAFLISRVCNMPHPSRTGVSRTLSLSSFPSTLGRQCPACSITYISKSTNSRREVGSLCKG
jgi:hypothetical protein